MSDEEPLEMEEEHGSFSDGDVTDDDGSLLEDGPSDDEPAARAAKRPRLDPAAASIDNVEEAEGGRRAGRG